MDIFHYVYAVLHHPEYPQRYAANLRRELPRIPFVAASTSTLSSRAKSRDPVSAGTQQKRGEEFAARTSSGGMRGKNASLGPEETQANTRSFDSVSVTRKASPFTPLKMTELGWIPAEQISSSSNPTPACHPERSRGTPCPLAPSRDVERNLLHELRPEERVARMPLRVRGNAGKRGLSTPLQSCHLERSEWTRFASPFTESKDLVFACVSSGSGDGFSR